MSTFQTLLEKLRKEREEQARKWAQKNQAQQFRRWFDLPQPERAVQALGGKTPGQVNSLGMLFDRHRRENPNARPSNTGIRQLALTSMRMQPRAPLRDLAQAFAPEPNVFERQRQAFMGQNPNEMAIQQGGQRAQQFFAQPNQPLLGRIGNVLTQQGRTAQDLRTRLQSMSQRTIGARNPNMERVLQQLSGMRPITEPPQFAQGRPPIAPGMIPSRITGGQWERQFSGEVQPDPFAPGRAVQEAIRPLPFVGPPAANVIGQFNNPLGAASLLFPPLRAGMIASGAGQIGLGALGQVAERFGAPTHTGTAGEVIGALAGPAAYGVGARRLGGFGLNQADNIASMLTRRRPIIRPQAVEDAGLTAARGRAGEAAVLARPPVDIPPQGLGALPARQAEVVSPAALVAPAPRIVPEVQPMRIPRPSITEPVEQTADVFGGHAVGAARFDPVERLRELIEKAEPVRAETESLKAAERSRRAAAANAKVRELVNQGVPYKEAYAQARSELAGKYPTAQFTPPEPLLESGEINSLFKMIDEKPGLFYFTRNNTTEALTKLLAGESPQPAEIKLLRNVFGGELMQAILKHRKIGAWENIASVLNAPRALQATADLSAPFRQGLMLVGRPAFWKSIPTMIRSFADEGVAIAVDDALRAGVTPKSGLSFDELMNKGGLYLAERGAANLDQHEEAFMSAFLNRVPGLNKIVRGSERAYVTFLNKLRADTFKSIVTKWEEKGIEYGDTDLADLGQWLNIATGRGPLPSDWAPMLNTIMFSPRLLTARLSTVPVSAKLMLKNGNLRGEVARDLVSTIGFGLGVMGMTAAGVEAWEKSTGQKIPLSFQLDPRSADFGKIRLGKTRIDPWGGFQPLARYTAQILTGQSINITGIHKVDRIESMKRFLQSKLAPVPGAATDIISGQTFMGQELTGKPEFIGEQVWNRLAPFVLQDMVDVVREHGAKGLVFAPLAGGGMGVQTYQTPTEKIKAKFEELYPDLGTYTGDAAQRAIVAADERFAGISQPSDSQEKLAKTQEELAAPLRQLADQVRQGNSEAGANFVRKYSEFKTQMFGATTQEYQGTDFGSQSNEYGKLVERFHNIDLGSYTDDAGNTDYGAFEAARDRILSQLPRAVQEALQNNLRLPEDLQDIERDFLVAKRVRDQLYDIPKLSGVTVEDYHQIQNLWAAASRIRNQGKLHGQDISVEQSIMEAGQDADPNIVWAAGYYRGNQAKIAQNPDYMDFLADNYDALNLFYPGLYTQTVNEELYNRGIGQ